jgi:MFS family permease
MKTVGKVMFAIVLAYAAFMLASLVGGVLAGLLGSMFRLSAKTIDSFAWTFPKIMFLGVLIILYVRSKRKKKNTNNAKHLKKEV